MSGLTHPLSWPWPKSDHVCLNEGCKDYEFTCLQRLKVLFRPHSKVWCSLRYTFSFVRDVMGWVKVKRWSLRLVLLGGTACLSQCASEQHHHELYCPILLPNCTAAAPTRLLLMYKKAIEMLPGPVYEATDWLSWQTDVLAEHICSSHSELLCPGQLNGLLPAQSQAILQVASSACR